MTTLVGPRLLLRDFVASDEDAVRALTADPVTARYADFGENDDAGIRRFLDDVLAEPADPARWSYSLAAVVAATDRLVGSVRIWVTDAEHRRGEVGFVFHRDVWGRGYATEAARLLLGFGRDELRLRRVVATCHPDNIGSARVLEKAGMRFEGRMRDHLRLRGEWRDSLLYAAVHRDVPEEERTAVRVVETADAPSHTGPVPQAVEAGGWIHVSALFGADPGTHEIPPDARAEAEQLFANLTAVLAAAGARLTDVVRVGIVMRRLQDDRPVFNRVWAERFGTHRPARSAIEAADFGRPGENARFMIEVVAYRG